MCQVVSLCGDTFPIPTRCRRMPHVSNAENGVPPTRFGRMLRSALDRKDWSINYFAQSMLGRRGHGQVSKWLTKQATVQDQTARVVAEAFGDPPDAWLDAARADRLELRPKRLTADALREEVAALASRVDRLETRWERAGLRHPEDDEGQGEEHGP